MSSRGATRPGSSSSPSSCPWRSRRSSRCSSSSTTRCRTSSAPATGSSSAPSGSATCSTTRRSATASGGRSASRSQVLLIQIPLGILLGLGMPKRGWRASFALVLMALPLLIPFNVVGTIWQIFARADIGLGGYVVNEVLGHPVQLRAEPPRRLVHDPARGHVALDAAGRPAGLRRPAGDPRRLLPGGHDRRRQPASPSSGSSSCRACRAC